MKIRDLVEIDGKNASGQKVSLLNPDKMTSGVRKDGMDSQRLQSRPSVVRRQAQSSYGEHDGRSYSTSSSCTNNSRRASPRDQALQLERMYSTGSSSINSSYSTSSVASSSSSMLGSRYDERARSSQTPPTPEQDEYMEDSMYDDPDSCATASPYPNFPNHHHSSPFVPAPTTLQPEFRQSSLEPGLHTRLLDLTVRGRHASDSGISPLMPSPSISSGHGTTLPSFNQAFSDYVISPNVSSQQSYNPYERDTQNPSPRSAYVTSPHAQSRVSTTSDSAYSPSVQDQRRPPLRLDVHRSDIVTGSHSSSNSMGSPQTPGASSDDSHSHHGHSHSRPHPRKSLSSRSASSSNLNRGPSDRHRYPCPLADEYECRSYFTTSGHASRHAKKHTGKRDAECPECHRCFTRKDNMEQHRRTHNKEGKKNKKGGAGLGVTGVTAGVAVQDLGRERSGSVMDH